MHRATGALTFVTAARISNYRPYRTARRAPAFACAVRGELRKYTGDGGFSNV
jgi:hypothetical protein